MSGTHAYDLGRVVALRHQTQWALGSLQGLRSGDPHAGDALGAVGVAMRVLSDHWMPAITEIERSDPLGGPTQSHALSALDAKRRDRIVDPYSRTGPVIPDRYSDLSNERLLDLLAEADRDWKIDMPLPPDADFLALADEIGERAQYDPEFAEMLIERLGHTDALALIAKLGHLGPELASMIVIPRFSEANKDERVTNAEIERRHQLTSEVLAYLTEFPDWCAAVLADEWVQAGLITDSRFDDDLVARFLAIGIIGAGDGSDEMFGEFAFWADNYDFPPGVARGLALAFTAVLPDYVNRLDRNSAVIAAGGGARRIGPPGRTRQMMYQDLEKLFGRIIMDPAAQVVLEQSILEWIEVQLPVFAHPSSVQGGDKPADYAETMGGLSENGIALVKLIFGDAASLQQARLDAEFDAESGQRDSAFGFVSKLLGMSPGAAVTVPVSTALVNRFGSPVRKSVPENDIVESLDGELTVILLRYIVNDDQAWRRFGLNNLSPAGQQKVREFDWSSIPTTHNAEDVVEYLDLSFDDRNLLDVPLSAFLDRTHADSTEQKKYD